MSDSFSELQKALIDVISGLKSMSIDILKKSDIYLQKVECLDLNCAEPVTQSIKMLVERMSNNLTQFGVVLDDAFNSYKKIQGSEEPFVSSEVVTGIKPCSTNKCLTKMDTEDEISLEPVTFSTEALIKQEDCHGEIECDEPTLQNVDFPVVSIFKDSAVDQEYLTSETKNESKKFETGNQMIVELKKENQFEDFCTDNLKTDLSDEIEEAEQLNSPLLPEKSRNRYENQLKDFNEWRQKNAASTVLNETVLLEYVSSLSKKFKASSVWTKFSMLKKAFIVTGEIDISRFGKVMAFMKNQKVNYGPKKFKILSVEQCRKFLLEAPDDFLLCKVVLIFGLYGACRQEELVKLTVDDIEDHQKYLIVNLTTNTSRSFIVPDASGTLNPYNIYQQYSRLRPSHVGTRRFFLGYQRGKCVAQPAGMHTIGGVPRKVATFLGLDHPESYTGHCLRRSGVSMAAEGYIERPIRSKIDGTFVGS